MPPFVSTECPKCKKPNRFDLAELRNKDGVLYKGKVYRSLESDEELTVFCEECGRRFKITVPRTEAKRGGRRDVEAD
jgi:hypothetical protein